MTSVRVLITADSYGQTEERAISMLDSVLQAVAARRRLLAHIGPSACADDEFIVTAVPIDKVAEHEELIRRLSALANVGPGAGVRLDLVAAPRPNSWTPLPWGAALLLDQAQSQAGRPDAYITYTVVDYHEIEAVMRAGGLPSR